MMSANLWLDHLLPLASQLLPPSYPPATLQLPAHQGMMMSANLRLGPMKRSNAGLTNLVYCAITPVM